MEHEIELKKEEEKQTCERINFRLLVSAYMQPSDPLCKQVSGGLQSSLVPRRATPHIAKMLEGIPQ